MNICAGMCKTWLEQNVVQNAPGMRAMVKHLFSPCNQRGAHHAGRRAQHLPLKKENALVWKEHSSSECFYGRVLTHTQIPSWIPTVFPRFPLIGNISPFVFPSRLFQGADGSLLIWGCINGQRCFSPPAVFKTTYIALSPVVCGGLWEFVILLFHFH